MNKDTISEEDREDAHRDETLTEAFHVLFDIKDEHANEAGQTDGVRMACYKAINALSAAMKEIGYEVPRRWDGSGR